jgi:HSP20 family molecular chaperone IbpA
MMADTNVVERNHHSMEPTTKRKNYYATPPVDIIERQSEYLIVADMPGTTEENIDIEYENGQLTLHGKVEERSCEEGACRLMQYESYDFYRVFRVGEGVDQSGITADYDHGVLTVHLPKAPEAKPRKISVRPK